MELKRTFNGVNFGSKTQSLLSLITINFDLTGILWHTEAPAVNRYFYRPGRPLVSAYL